MTEWLWIVLVTAYFFIIFGCVVVVLSENRNPVRALSWVMALIFLPVVGLVFYLFFGRSLKGRQMISRRSKRKLMQGSGSRRLKLKELPLTDSEIQMVNLAYNLSHYPLTLNNEIKTFTTGAEKFIALKEDLRNARKSIFLQYYIFNDDRLGEEIADILCEKARSGVCVRVIYDHVGSFSTPNRFFRKMVAAGAEVHPFFKVTFPQLANRINWRNHRKIVVIDSEIGYIGGMNIADRYVTGLSKGEAWRDTHFRLRGGIVESLLYSFAIDWNFLRPSMEFPEKWSGCDGIHNDTGVQLVTSGPVDKWKSIALCFMRAITSAKRSIYIQTPYFLPTDALQGALEAASLANIDVRIMLPSKSDSRLLQFASFSYVTQCLRAGIKVYLYEPGMLHSKTMVIDDNFATVGSTNFDFRSFENNFECNLMVYDREFNARQREIFFNDLKQCRKLRLQEWMKRPLWRRTLESLARPLSPVL